MHEFNPVISNIPIGIEHFILQVLHEELSEKLSKVDEKSSEAEVEEAIKLVMQAKYDNKIWKSGLDISYKTFLANKPSPTMKSVLLSILWDGPV